RRYRLPRRRFVPRRIQHARRAYVVDHPVLVMHPERPALPCPPPPTGGGTALRLVPPFAGCKPYRGIVLPGPTGRQVGSLGLALVVGQDALAVPRYHERERSPTPRGQQSLGVDGGVAQDHHVGALGHAQLLDPLGRQRGLLERGPAAAGAIVLGV